LVCDIVAAFVPENVWNVRIRFPVPILGVRVQSCRRRVRDSGRRHDS
jgi:hypothetical protein